MVDLLTAAHTDGAGLRDRGGERLHARIRAATAEAAGNPAGWWTPTLAELTWAAHRAWRDEPRCIGRWRWNSLTIRDSRQLTDPDQVAADLAEHLRDTTRDGQIKPVVTLLHPDVDIRNEQLVGYAGYRQPGGEVLGDPRHTTLTDLIADAAFASGNRSIIGRWYQQPTRFDVLPLLIDTRSDHGTDRAHRFTSVHPLPADAIREIELHHSEYPWFADLGLRWYAVPALASHQLALTDTVAYPVVFSGHYLSTEIASRDLADTGRYNTLPAIAARLGLDTSRPRTLWHARAELVLHEAVLHSFDAAGVRIFDPVTEADHYQHWVDREHAAGRTVREDWSWIVPPHAPARTAVYGRYLPQPVPSLPAYRLRTPH